MSDTTLEISGKERALQAFPDFDFYKLRRIVRLQWESHSGEDGEKTAADLIVTTTYDTGSASMAEVTLRFGGVVRGKLPELFPLVFLSEIEIEDVRGAQLEGLGYKVKNQQRKRRCVAPFFQAAFGWPRTRFEKLLRPPTMHRGELPAPPDAGFRRSSSSFLAALATCMPQLPACKLVGPS